VHYVCASDVVEGQVDATVRELLSSGPTAMALSKELIRRVACEMPDNVIGLTSETIAQQRVSPEGQEGMRAFLQKRKPDWSA
jgi:methylglutaconyl-CoA hydratase